MSKDSYRSSITLSALALAAISSLPMSATRAAPVYAAAKGDDYQSPLATSAQKLIETRALRIRARQDIAEARARARQLLQSHKLARSRENAELIDKDLDRWLLQLIVQEILPEYPGTMYYAISSSGHSWMGINFPPTGLAIENPDNIYRLAAVRGSDAYTLTGKVEKHRPAFFVFQLADYPVGVGWVKSNGRDNSAFVTLTSNDLKIAEDGSFTISIDTSPAGGRSNHIQLPYDGLFMLGVRDALTDWTQIPNTVSLKTSEPIRLSPKSDDEIANAAIKHLPGFVSFILDFDDSYNGPPPTNSFTPVYGRVGGWGYASVAPFHLGDDEALIVVVSEGDADYFGIQTSDAWMLTPSSSDHLVSRNAVQSVANANGTRTFIVSPQDPGLSNWVGTAGLHEGWVQIRWQGMPANTTGHDLFRSARVVKMTELKSISDRDPAQISAEQRKLEMNERRKQWQLRSATSTP